jgi:hypothetical protein
MAEILGFLIWLAIAAIVIYVVIWAITTIIALPGKVVQLLYVIGVLILLWYCVMYFPMHGLPGFPHR